MEQEKSFAIRLKSALKARNKKPIDLTNGAGLNKSLVSGYLNDRYEAKNDKIEIIAKYLNVSQLYLMGYTSELGEYKDVDTGYFVFNFDEGVSEQNKVIHKTLKDIYNDRDDISKLKIKIIENLDGLNKENLQMINTLISGMKK